MTFRKATPGPACSIGPITGHRYLEAKSLHIVYQRDESGFISVCTMPLHDRFLLSNRGALHVLFMLESGTLFQDAKLVPDIVDRLAVHLVLITSRAGYCGFASDPRSPGLTTVDSHRSMSPGFTK
jgi:hypothetical protein